MAGVEGLEPSQTVLETGVLPLTPYPYIKFYAVCKLKVNAHFGGPAVSGNKNIPGECFYPKVPAAENELKRSLMRITCFTR